MLVYPVPAAVTQARIELVNCQNEKAAPSKVAEAVLDVFAAKNKAEREALADMQAATVDIEV